MIVTTLILTIGLVAQEPVIASRERQKELLAAIHAKNAKGPDKAQEARAESTRQRGIEMAQNERAHRAAKARAKAEANKTPCNASKTSRIGSMPSPSVSRNKEKSG